MPQNQNKDNGSFGILLFVLAVTFIVFYTRLNSYEVSRLDMTPILQTGTLHAADQAGVSMEVIDDIVVVEAVDGSIVVTWNKLDFLQALQVQLIPPDAGVRWSEDGSKIIASGDRIEVLFGQPACSGILIRSTDRLDKCLQANVFDHVSNNRR